MTQPLSWVDEFFTEGEGGTVEVADDIDRSGGDGTPIDRVQGINGVALETDDTLAVGEVWKKGTGAKLRAGKPVAPGWLDVKDYGAVGDGVTDDAPAFRDALASLPLSTADLPGNRARIHIPPGNYRFASQVIVDRKVQIKGAVAGGGVTITCDDYGSGFVLAGFGWGTGGDAGGVEVQDIHFEGGPNHLSVPKWAPGTAYTGGASTPSHILPANRGCPESDQPHSYGWHYRCMKSGTSQAASASPAGITTPYQWSAGLTLAVGDVVKQCAASGATLPGRYDVLFRVTSITTGITGTTQPAAFTTAVDLDTGIADGGVTYAAFTTGEPNWHSFRFMDISTPWTAAETLGWGAVRHATFATNRWDVFFMAETVTGGDTAVTSGSQPAAFATCKVGDTIADGANITWRAWATGAEATPAARQDTHAYVVGDKIRALDGTRWVCTISGTSAGAEPGGLVASDQWDVVVDGDASWRYYYTGGAMLLDNGVVWSARVASAIIGATPCHTRHISAHHFPNASQHFQCDLGALPSLDCSGSRIEGAESSACGIGLQFLGGDANTCTIIAPKITGQWEVDPFPAAERGIVDASFLGNRFYSPWVQSLRGPGFQVGSTLSGAPSSTGGLFGGYFEAVGDLDIQASGYHVSGTTGGGAFVCFGFAERRGFTKRSMYYGAPSQGDEMNLSGYGRASTDNELCQFALSDHKRIDPVGGFMAWMYNRTLTGWWNHEYYLLAGVTTLQESSAAATEGYGWLGFPRGFFFGASDPDRFFVFPTKAASLNGQHYGGKRLVGYIRYRSENIVAGGWAADICTAAGYDGQPWFSHAFSGPYTGVYAAFGDTVIPTSASNLGCWEFIGGAGASTVQPTWPATGGLVQGDEFTDGQDNVWRYRGLQPTWVPFWSIANRGAVATADATPVYVTLATLAVGDVRQVDVIAKVAKADGSTRQVFKLTGLYYGAAGPTATIDGSVGSTATGTGAAAVTLDVTGATVRLKITGVAATDLVTTYEANVL